MARRRWQLDPELAPVARERLRRVLGRDPDPEARSDDTRPPRYDPGRTGPPEVARRAQPGADALGFGPGWPAGPDEVDRSSRWPVSEDLRGPVGLDELAPPRHFTRWHLGVVAGLVLLGLLWGGWTLLRARPVALAAPSVVQTADAPASTASTSSGPAAGSATPGATASVTPSAPAPPLVVHVLGAVRRPGLVRLPQRARVQDAIDAAGGLTHDADPGELDLAQLLADGQQVLIGTRQHAAGEVRDGSTSGGGAASGSGSGSAGSGSGSGSGSIVDLNQATAAQLEELPGVGPVTAEKILAWRSQHGRFSRPEELQEVGGIGPKTYAQIAPHVRV